MKGTEKIKSDETAKSYLQAHCSQGSKDLSEMTFDTTIISIARHFVTMFDISYFPQINEIWLNNNQIQSIEGLSFMKMPHLRKLSFSYNKLTNISNLRKADMPVLNQLQLDHNQIIQQNKLAETLLPVKQVKIWVYFDERALEKDHVNKRINAKLAPLGIVLRS